MGSKGGDAISKCEWVLRYEKSYLAAIAVPEALAKSGGEGDHVEAAGDVCSVISWQCGGGHVARTPSFRICQTIVRLRVIIDLAIVKCQ